MYLIDTNVISEARKGKNADKGVREFFHRIQKEKKPVYVSVITIGELRRGIEKIRYRGDEGQALRLEEWLQSILDQYSDQLLDFDIDMAQVWGRLRVPHHENTLDKQIAATALIYDLTVVTRNMSDFKGCGVRLHNPFYSMR